MTALIREEMYIVQAEYLSTLVELDQDFKSESRIKDWRDFQDFEIPIRFQLNLAFVEQARLGDVKNWNPRC